MITKLNDCKYYAGIQGTGYYVPDRVVTNEELVQYIDTTDEWIQNKIGIKERRIASEGIKTSDLAYEAARMALEDADISPLDIDLIILNRLCPDHRDPATACRIQSKLGAYNAAAFDINVGGCPGSVYSLNIGVNFITNGTCKNVLVIGADVAATTLIDWRDRGTCCFFGDGAGAVVLSRASKPGIIGYSMFADGRGYDAIVAPDIGGRSFPEKTGKENWEEIGYPYLKMDGKAVWNFATNAFPDAIRKLTEEVGIKLSDIDVVIPHQANLNIITEGMKKLEIPFERAFVNIDKYGNMGGASVYIALSEAVRQGRILPGNKVALSAFGAGLAWGSALIEWNSRDDFRE